MENSKENVEIDSLGKESKFIAKSVYDDKFLFRYAWASTLKFPLLLVHLGAMISFLAFGIYYLVKGDKMLMGIILPIMALIGIPCLVFIGNITIVKTMKKAYAKYEGSQEFNVIYDFREENILVKNSAMEKANIIEHSQLKSVRIAFGLFLIETRDKQILIVDANKFIEGERDSFQKYIKEVIDKNNKQ